MKNQELFDKTVSILVKAYQKDTLLHGDCYACAVGNLAASSCGQLVERVSDRDAEIEGMLYADTLMSRMLAYKNPSDFQPNLTGYSIKDLHDIERAFEHGYDLENDKDGYLGLMSVIDTLMQIHEATTEEATQAKGLFVKIPA